MKQHWVTQKERGNAYTLRITRFIVHYLPIFAVRVITFFVVGYFYLTARKARLSIAEYHQKLRQIEPYLSLPRAPIFRQFLAFGESITDRFSVWQGKLTPQDLIIDDCDSIYHRLRQPTENPERGQILICAHLGNIEIFRALETDVNNPHFRLNVILHSGNAEMFNQALQKSESSKLSLIQVEQLDAQKMLLLHQRIEKGEWLAIAADRIPVRGDKISCVNFLGAPASFPQGAWLLAALLKTPINTIFCLKEKGRYRIKLRRFADPITGRGKIREAKIQQSVQQYADILAKECCRNPLLWFNFYDFWEKE